MPGKKPREEAFRRKYNFFREAAARPELIRDGSIHDWIRKKAFNDEADEAEYSGYFEEMAATLTHEHPGAKGRATLQADVIINTLRKAKAIKINSLKEAVRYHLKERLSPTFTPDHVDRVRSMVDYLYQNREKIRKDALLGFMDKWNTGRKPGEWVSYDALKNDLAAISYAYLPVANRETEKEHVVEAHREDFAKARVLKYQDAIDPGKAAAACGAFIDHSVEGDLARIKRETTLVDKLAPKHADELERLQEKFADLVSELYRLRRDEPNVHPATASNSVWQEVGWPLHAVLPDIKDTVYKLYGLAERKQHGKDMTLDDYSSLPVKPSDPQLLETLAGMGIVPLTREDYKPINNALARKEISKHEHGERIKALESAHDERKLDTVAEAMTRVWLGHLQHAKAVLEYEQARHALKPKKEYHKDIGWGEPLGRKGFKKEFKGAIIERPGDKFESEARSHLIDGDVFWHSFKQFEENEKLLKKKEKK